MKKTFFAPRRCLRAALLTASLASIHVYTAAAPAQAAAAQPKLVVVMVVDGLPNEQVQRYRDQFGQGGFRRLLEQGASFSNAHQAHGITVTAIGHAAILTGAYPYQHGIIGNNWIDPVTHKLVYCTEDRAYTYINEQTAPNDGTSPANLRVDTLGDELRYATGNRAKVVTVSGKDRGAIMLAGKTGTAYMYMDGSGNFASIRNGCSATRRRVRKTGITASRGRRCWPIRPTPPMRATTSILAPATVSLSLCRARTASAMPTITAGSRPVPSSTN
jgi:hypothetical protein